MKRLLILSALAVLVLGGPLCKTVSKELQEAMKPVQLTYWRVFDDSDAFGDLIAEYNKQHPNVNVTYRKLRYDEFEKVLLDALAEDRGPDIFSIHNTWIGGWQSKLLPQPATITVPVTSVKGTIKKERVSELISRPGMSLRELKSKFVDQVAEDAVLKDIDPQTGAQTDKIYGLPLFMDTLALYYNKELLNAAGIPEPAKDWQTLQEHVKKMTKQDSAGNITQSGAALGAAKNIDRATDILSVLMMQNGAKMANGAATFNITPPGLEGRTNPPGMEALIFYTDFASPQKEVYTWNENMPGSLDAFIQGRAAYFLGYNYHLPTIKARAPKLAFGIAKLPQILGNPEINFANYWVEVVSRKTKNPNESWDFLQFIAASEQNAQKFLDRTGKPTALRGLIKKQSEDIDLYAFVSQILTAKSWYHGRNALAAEQAMRDLITDVLTGNRTLPEAMNIAVSKVNQTL